MKWRPLLPSPCFPLTFSSISSQPPSASPRRHSTHRHYFSFPILLIPPPPLPLPPPLLFLLLLALHAYASLTLHSCRRHWRRFAAKLDEAGCRVVPIIEASSDFSHTTIPITAINAFNHNRHFHPKRFFWH